MARISNNKMITGCVRRVPRSLRQEDTHRAVGRPERRLRYPPRAAAGQADGADEGMGGRGAPQVGRRRGQRRRRPPSGASSTANWKPAARRGPAGVVIASTSIWLPLPIILWGNKPIPQKVPISGAVSLAPSYTRILSSGQFSSPEQKEEISLRHSQ